VKNALSRVLTVITFGSLRYGYVIAGDQKTP